MYFNEYVFSEPYFGWLCRGVMFTLLITLITSVLAFVLGFIIVTQRTSSSNTLRLSAVVYINLFRNIPPVPLLLFLVFGLPGLYSDITGSTFPPGTEFYMLVIGLSLNTSAYVAEIIRSGINAVPETHFATARILGLGAVTTRIKVIYPQALRVSLPALGTRFIHNMKNSTIALVLPLAVDNMEVLGQAGRIAGQTFAWAEPLLFAAAIHLMLALIFSFILNYFARCAQAKVEITP